MTQARLYPTESKPPTTTCSRAEIRDNLRAMQNAGAHVRYYPVDVCDERAFGDLIDAIYHDYGRLDGVIHGAGIIEDKFIEDKTLDSFARCSTPRYAAPVS